MSGTETSSLRVGWVGTGRMGFSMAKRLIEAGWNLSVYNRTRAKAEPLGELGATVVDSPRELAGCDVTFTMVSGPADLEQVVSGPQGILADAMRAPRIHIDCSSVSTEGSAKVRENFAARGAAMIAAPVSGNAKVVEAGRLSVVASGPKAAFDEVLPLLEAVGEGVTWVGEGELARMVKICHNILLGVVTQSLAEITVLAEKGGVPRHAFLDFINKSVMGSMFTRYKTPSFVNLDWKPTFTPGLLKKDLDLGLAAGRALGVPQPLTALTREIVQSLIGHGYVEEDFGTLLELQAKASGFKLESENVEVGDGLKRKG